MFSAVIARPQALCTSKINVGCNSSRMGASVVGLAAVQCPLPRRMPVSCFSKLVLLPVAVFIFLHAQRKVLTYTVATNSTTAAIRCGNTCCTAVGSNLWGSLCLTVALSRDEEVGK